MSPQSNLAKENFFILDNVHFILCHFITGPKFLYDVLFKYDVIKLLKNYVPHGVYNDE